MIVCNPSVRINLHKGSSIGCFNLKAGVEHYKKQKNIDRTTFSGMYEHDGNILYINFVLFSAVSLFGLFGKYPNYMYRYR